MVGRQRAQVMFFGNTALSHRDAVEALAEDARRVLRTGIAGIDERVHLDQLEAKARSSVAERYPDLDPAELDELGRQIATAALRFFMVKAQPDTPEKKTTTEVAVVSDAPLEEDEGSETALETGGETPHSKTRRRGNSVVRSDKQHRWPRH